MQQHILLTNILKTILRHIGNCMKYMCIVLQYNNYYNTYCVVQIAQKLQVDNNNGVT